jgi:hypothetical protein
MTQQDLTKLTEDCKEIEHQIWTDYVDVNEKCEPIIDGIVDIEKYLSSKFQILWILKEPYDDVEDGLAAGGGWHFANDFLAPTGFYKRMGRSRTTWQPIIYVNYGLLNGCMNFDDMDYIRNNQTMTEIVRHIAVINVKKLPGFTRTNDFGPIWAAYNKHKQLLHKQIDTYNPNIIIGGSTLHLFYKELGLEKDKEKVFGCVEYYEKDDKLFIAAYHPAQTTVTRDRYVDDIINLVKQWTATQTSQPPTKGLPQGWRTE